MNTIQGKWLEVAQKLAPLTPIEEMEDFEQVFYLGASAILQLQQEAFNPSMSDAAMTAIMDGWRAELMAKFGVVEQTIDSQDRS